MSSFDFFNWVPLIVAFPVAGLLINIIVGGRLKEKAIGWLASGASGLAFVVSVLLLLSLVGHPEGKVVPLLDWITIGNLVVPWAFQVDTLSVTMMLVVSGVGTLIHIYAIGYMHEDVQINGDPGRYRRFFIFFNLFIAAMLILVSGANYLMLFVGWEGVGLCSYLLIGFWYDKGKDGIGNALAAKKAFVVNRIGDLGFLLAAFAIFWTFGSFDFKTIFEQVPDKAATMPAVLPFIAICMLVGVTGKSAQLPLYVWLPDAMAGPTPVSALIHAATMVTAGVYLVARSNVLYSSLINNPVMPQAHAIMPLVGGLTAFFAATIAVGQFDIKKVLAYSTISQLGFMVAAVGMGAYAAGMFHLVTHAFFKALLFLSAGSVILGVEHGLHHVEHDARLKKLLKHHGNVVGPASHGSAGHEFDPQDMRNMGGLRTKMKTTFWVYLIGAIALAGIPPLAGFWSKDEILAEASVLNVAVYGLLTAAAFLTAFYMGRQVWMIFFGEPRNVAAEHAKENPPIMTVPLIILAGLSVIGGALNLPGLHTFTAWLEHTIEIHPGEFKVMVAALSTGLALLAIALALYLYGRRADALKKLPAARKPDDVLRTIIGPVFTALNQKWWVDELYWAVIVKPYIALSKFLADIIDWRFWHEWFHDTLLLGGYNLLTRLLAVKIDLGGIDALANGLAAAIQGGARQARRVETGYVRNYALSIFLGLVLIISYLGYLILR